MILNVCLKKKKRNYTYISKNEYINFSKILTFVLNYFDIITLRVVAFINVQREHEMLYTEYQHVKLQEVPTAEFNATKLHPVYDIPLSFLSL